MSILLLKITDFLIKLPNWKDLLPGAEINLPASEADTDHVTSLIKNVILIALSLLAVILVGLVVYGGFLWITAGDKEEQLQKAKKVMKGGGIGLLITFGFLVLLGIVAGILGINITDFSFLDDILGT